MTKNVGQTDKLIRLIIAVVIVLLVYFDKIPGDTMQIVVLSIAFIAALTSLLNFCLLYKVFKFDTCKK